MLRRQPPVEKFKKTNKWLMYEKQIYDTLKKNHPGCYFKSNDSIIGKFSKRKRQIDILIKGKLADWDIFGVVDCKCFSKKINVKIVESFIGFMEDVGANLGIIITNIGYTKAARNRAIPKGIKLDIVKFQDLDEYEFDWDICQLCDPGEDRPPAVVNWGVPYGVEDDKAISIVQSGRCDWCNSISIKCQACGVITPVSESDYNKEIDCEGGCGLIFKVISEYVGSGLFEEHMEIIVSPSQVSYKK